MKELNIVTYIKKYGLEKTISDFNLICKDYGHKILLKYNQLSTPTLMAMPEVQECRGLVLEKGTWYVMNFGLTKFFNAEETNAHKIDWDTANVLEKLDGTCVMAYYDWYDKVWYAGTTGTANGEGEVNNKLGTTFNNLFWKTLKEKYNVESSNLTTDFTYVFELTTPYNIVVKPHGESSASLLTVRSLNTLEELSFNEVKLISDHLKIPQVKKFNFSSVNVGVLIKTFNDMVWYDEGYVVVDGNFNRIKIKNPAYVAVHHLKGKTAEYNIMEIIKTNELEEFISVFPDRKDELLSLKTKYDELIERLECIWVELKDFKPKNIEKKERKKFADAVFYICAKNNLTKFTGLYFGLIDGKVDSVKDFVEETENKFLYQIL